MIMKKLILVVIVLVSLKSYAQRDPKKFTGLGVLKIGSDTTSLINYAIENVNYIRDCDDLINLINAENSTNTQLLRLSFKEGTRKISEVSKNPNVKDYWLSELVISGVKIKSVRIRYYKNKLISVRSFDIMGSLGVMKALETKYGKGTLKRDKKIVYCTYRMTGIKEELEEETFYHNWNNADIITLIMLWSNYDDKCKKNTNMMFTYYVEDPVELKQWDAAKEIMDKKAKIKSLEGF